MNIWDGRGKLTPKPRKSVCVLIVREPWLLSFQHGRMGWRKAATNEKRSNKTQSSPVKTLVSVFVSFRLILSFRISAVSLFRLSWQQYWQPGLVEIPRAFKNL